VNIAIQPDSDNDCLYLSFSAGFPGKAAIAKSLRATEDVTLDFDQDGCLIGVDVMNASSALPASFRHSLRMP
jgi:uncharacterized protein YuzE